MLSLIICSTSKETPKWLVDNIKDTVGVEYEIIHIDNSENKYNMCSAYNEGVVRARGEVLCFMHEDIKYYSPNWGRNIEKHMQNPDVCILGVFGSKVVPKDFDFRFSGFTIGHLVQRTVRITNPEEYMLDGIHWDINGSLEKVAMVDGCWFCTKASLFRGEDAIRFDDKTFDSFHLYDCDICMQVNERGGGIFVVSDVVLEHFSLGVFGEGYLEGIRKFFTKWKDELPCCTDGMRMEDCQERLQKFKVFYERMLRMDAHAMRLRRYFAAMESGKPVEPLDREEKRALWELEFRYAKSVIKNARTKKESYKAFDVFPNLPLLGKCGKLHLLVKFVFYRCLKSGDRKAKSNEIIW